MTADQVPFGMFTVNAALAVRTWPAWLAQATGITAGDVLGQPLDAVVPDLRERGLLAALERVLAGGTVEVLAPALHHYVIACPPSVPSATFDRMQQRVTVGPIRDGERIVGAVVTIEDVTARIEAERALAQRIGSTQASTGRTTAGTDPPSLAPLTRALGDASPAVRRAAVAGLAAHGPVIVQALVETLREQHGDLNVLSSALSLLEMSDIDVVEPLVACLSDADTNLRIQAALILGGQHDGRAVTALVRALDDPDLNVQFHAIEALGRLRAPEAVAPLAALAERRDFFLSFPAVHALAQIGDARVAPRLVPLLGDDLLRAPAVEALGALGDDRTVPALVARLNQAGAPTETIADALTLLYDRMEERYGAGDGVADLVRIAISAGGTQNLLDAVDRVSGERLRGLARVLGWLDGAAAQRALARLLGQPSVRAQVIEALVRYGGRVVDLLIEQLPAEDLETRHAAAVALGRIGDERAAGPLVRALADCELAVAAAGALARIGAAEAFEPLLGLLGDEDVAVRQAAIAALNSIGHPEMPGRIRALLDDARPVVRESAVKVAGYFGYPDCLDAVLARARDPFEEVRRAAVEHLPFFDDARAAAAVCDAVVSDPSPRVRAAAAAALGRLEDARGVALRALGDADAWVRYFAVRALASWHHPDCAAAAIDRLERDPAGHVRLAAVEVLGTLRPPDAVPLLVRLAEGGDPDSAGAAIRALGQYAGVEAGAALDRAARAREPWRRLCAVTAFPSRGDAQAVAMLRWIAAGDEDEEVAAGALQALARVTGGSASEAALQALLDLLAEPNRWDDAVAVLAAVDRRHLDAVAAGLGHASPAVRRHTVEALGRMRHVDASRALERALRDPDASVRLAAVGELRQLGSTGAARHLHALARTDPDPDVRAAALRAMARSRAADEATPVRER